jgi:beta-mannosidase
MKLYRIFIALFLIFFSWSTLAQIKKIELSGTDWKFCKSGSNKWYPASIPGCVHTDLLANGLIPDPFFGENEKVVQWVDTCDWEYCIFFQIDKQLLSYENIALNFEGLDTYADIFLNGELIQKSENMFCSWELPCKAELKEGENELRIVFLSTVREAKKAYDVLPVPLPYDERVMVRKAQYQFGWDWGPRFVTMGIWKPVRIVAWNQLKIEDVHFSTISLDEKKAELSFMANVSSTNKSNIEANLYCENTAVQKIKVNLKPGLNEVVFRYKMSSPELWWPNGMGKQKLYSFKIRVENKEGNYDEYNQRIGLRTIELVQDKDSAGQSFYFKVNGIPMFAKGANYIPQDAFPSRVDSIQYSRLLSDAADCHMNMLRVWGGGIYENDLFYNLCDEKGILIWQDFMFACNMYPGDEPFRIWTREEIKEQVIRLRNHPSLALWCGNNEIDEGWNNWGMQKQYKYTQEDSLRIWGDYNSLFRQLIPEILKQADPSRPYVESSPLHGWGRKESMTEGDSHYWGVWWGDEPFEVFNKKVPRFMSEYGFQGFPDLNTLNKVIPSGERKLFSDALKNHEKHPRGFELITAAMQRDYWVPETYENYAMLSQFVQARAMRIAIEAQRRARPYCMGTLYWQLNDCWPVISWSGIDYYGRWKAAQYIVKREYSTVILSPVIENDKLNIYGISDSISSVKATLKAKVISNSGTILWSVMKDTTLASLSSAALMSYSSKYFFSHFDSTKSFLYTELSAGSDILASSELFFCKPANYQQPDFTTNLTYEAIDSLNYRVQISSDIPVVGLFITTDDPALYISDNFFNLLPWKPKTIVISSDSVLTLPERKLHLSNLNYLR